MAISSFETCLKFTLKHEGGFVNHPKDRGGPTKFGITKKTLEMYRDVSGLTDQDMYNLQYDEAAAIYLNEYWRPLRANLFSPRLALFLFDQSVNRGTVSVVKQLQRAVNDGLGRNLEVDGVVGPKTISAVTYMPGENELLRNLLRGSVNFYVDLVKRDPSQLAFLRGWLNRIFDLWDEIFP